MTPPGHPPFSSKLLRLLGWLLAWSPAAVVLAMLLPLRVPVPFEDSWAYVKQYQAWSHGDYGWRDLLAPHNQHPCAVGKLIYFVVLHWMDGDVGVLPLVAWAFSLAISVSVFWLLKPLRRLAPGWSLLLVFCANLTIFTAAQGHSWVWDFIYQNFIPGTAFCMALACLVRWPGSWLSLVAAAFLSVAATFSSSSGLLAGFLLTPMIWLQFPGKSSSTRSVITLCWVVVMGCIAWTALTGFGHALNMGSESRVGDLAARPVMVAQFVLVLLGYLLGNGTTMEPGLFCAVIGSGLVALLLTGLFRIWQLRKEPGFFQAVVPCLLITLLGLGNALLICYGRLRFSLIAAMAPRYITFTLFFALGVLLLSATVALRDTPSGWYRVLARRVGILLLGAFIALHVVNWNHGWQHMKWEHERMTEDRALLSFAKVLPLDPEVLWQYPDGSKDLTTRLALFLEQQGKLKGVRLVQETNLASFRRGSPLPEKWAWLDTPAVHDGTIHLQGACGVSKDMVSLPELVLITAQAAGGQESVISFAVPSLPFDFFENEWLRRLHVDHYFGWERALPADRFPKGQTTIRAYGYWTKGRSVRPLHREHVLQL